jgi:hypothetical protein
LFTILQDFERGEQRFRTSTVPVRSSAPRCQRGEHGGSSSELDCVDALVLGLLNVLGLFSVLGLLSALRPRPVGLDDRPVPRWRIGPGRLLGLLNPVGLPRPDGLPNEFAPVEPAGFVGLVDIGVRVELRELPSDDGAVESEETDEPGDNVGAQLTPGVIVGDGLVAVVGVVEPVAVVPVVPVVPGLAVCANAGAVLKAIAHARPAPLRIGIFRILIKCFSFLTTFN